MGYEIYLHFRPHRVPENRAWLDEAKLAARNRQEIDQFNVKLAGQKQRFRVLKGCEANIMPDGSIDIADAALAELDYVIAGVHSSFHMSRADMTQRLQTAMTNPHVDIISHPTGRILKRREEYEVDFGELLNSARETGTILEINSFPDRLDLNDVNIRAAREAGVRMVINSDAHRVNHLHLVSFGISQARRGPGRNQGHR